MLQSLKPPVFITIIVAAVLIIGVVGYKLIAPSAPPPQTHAAALDFRATMEKKQQQNLAGTPPAQPYR